MTACFVARAGGQIKRGRMVKGERGDKRRLLPIRISFQLARTEMPLPLYALKIEYRQAGSLQVLNLHQKVSIDKPFARAAKALPNGTKGEKPAKIPK